MASKPEKWVGAQGFSLPVITHMLLGTKQSKLKVALHRLERLWSCSPAEENRGYSISSEPPY